MNDVRVIDRYVFSELQVAAGHDFVAELVQTFSEEAPALLTELRQAQAEGAPERFRRAAHSLKSNSSTFGATRLAELSRTLELDGVPASTEPLVALQTEYERSLLALTQLASAAPGA